MSSRIVITLNFILSLVLLGLLVCAFLYPEYLAYLKLNVLQAELITVFIISLILLVNAFSFNLSVFWRICCALLAILVLIEFILMNQWWKVFVK
ncbi:MAG: hypothetical protein ABIH00_10300 [Armatimonadota bacterium]